MQASEIITDVRRELLETSGAFWSDAELLRHLNRGEMDFVNRTRILEDKAFLTTTPGRSDYPLPSNWLSARLVLLNTKENETDTNSWQRLWPTSLEKKAQETPNFLRTDEDYRGTPQKYDIWGNDIYLTPAPRSSVSGDLYLFYNSKPIPITSTSQSINIDESLSEALNAYILWKAWSKSKERALAEEQKQIYFEYVQQGRRWKKRRAGDARNLFDISSPYGFNMSVSDIPGFFE